MFGWGKQYKPVYMLGNRSKRRLNGVHPDLVRVVERAIEITNVDFTVLEGLRTFRRQKKLIEQGKSKTYNSRHLPRKAERKGIGEVSHAVDLGAYVSGKILWNWHYYEDIAKAMKQASNELNIPIEWGGDWKSFKDGVHFQLPWKDYPVSV